jgi:hypothetical protein
MLSTAPMSNPTLFLCWSGQRSKQVAEAFEEYFKTIFKGKKPRVAMSETLIAKGAPWSSQLLGTLQNAQAGIVCLTPENRTSPWLHFEGGALATHGLKEKDKDNDSILFGFLFTFDNTQFDGPLSLFQATTYRRDYARDRADIAALTSGILKRFQLESDSVPPDALDKLMGRLRELQYLGVRDFLPTLEGHARQVLLALESSASSSVQRLSAMFSLQRLLEDREREIEIICAPSQLMFFRRLIETLSAATRAIIDGTDDSSQQRLKRLLQVAIEPLAPVLDDAWRYDLYAAHGTRDEAYRKQKLLLIQPLESTLQRAELAERQSGVRQKFSADAVPPGHLLSANEKPRAIRSYWCYDRVAAYLHYCEDVSYPTEKQLRDTLFELTRAVLKELAVIELSYDPKDLDAMDELPLRFALRALILKIKLGIGYKYDSDNHEPLLKPPQAREIIESRIKAETGMSFPDIQEFIACLKNLGEQSTVHYLSGTDSPLMALCKDFERLVGNPA